MSKARAVAVSILLGFAMLEGSAMAHCRSTTCRDTASKECPKDANECVTSGAKLFWPTSCISYAANRLGTQDLDPDETHEVIRKSFEAWLNIDCPDGTTPKLKLVERDPVTCKRSQYNKDGPNLNVVLFQDDDWQYRGKGATLAKTSVTYDNETGEIFDADIEVNTANNTFTISDPPETVEFDLQSVLTHEVGHFLGIAHSDKPSVMFFEYNRGTILRKLTPDDVAAVCEVFPSTSDADEKCEPKGGFSSRCPKEDAGGLCSVEPGVPAASYGVVMLFVGSGLLTVRARRRRGLGGKRERTR